MARSELDNEITQRLRDELSRLSLSLAGAAVAMGDSDRTRIKNIMAGNQRCPSDVLARLAQAGVDVLYVLTGDRARVIEGTAVWGGEDLDDAQLHVLIEHMVPELARGIVLVALGMKIHIGGDLADVIRAQIDFQLRALQRLRAQAMQPSSTPQQ